MNPAPTLVIFLALVSAPAQAAVVSLAAQGTVTGVSAAKFPGFSVGDEFRVVVTYSDGFPDLDPSLELGRYDPTDLRVELAILGHETIYQSSGGSIGVFTGSTFDGIGTFPQISITSTDGTGRHFFFMFLDTDASFIVDTDLPDDFGDVSDFDSVGVSLLDVPVFTGSSGSDFSGSVSLLAIPEPSTTTILASTLLALLLRHRDRRGHRNIAGTNRAQQVEDTDAE